jgi:arylsulfatase
VVQASRLHSNPETAMERTQRLNILHIMADQHRPDFMGCAGAEFVQTPNIDRLAKAGTQFTRCFTNSPLCVPARVSLATGLYPWRVGAMTNHAFLPARVPTFYQRLRDSGFRVGCVGKLDLAKPDHYNGRHGDRPCVYSWGFTHPEECEGKAHAGSSRTPIGPYTWHLKERGLLESFYDDYRKRGKLGLAAGTHDSVLPADAFEDTYIGRRTSEWIERIPDDFPWYMFVSFVGPHDPYDPPAEYSQRYRDARMPAPISDDLDSKPRTMRRRRISATPEQIAQARRQYCGSITAIDDAIGGILQTLERRGMAGNTVIVYSSDHGEMMGDHGLFTKHVAYEAALGVPLIVSGPGLPAGKQSDALIELSDLNPTLCELSGLPPQENIDARSFVPLLRGERSSHREDIISGVENTHCIRTARHKLITHDGDDCELYDLEADPQERTNITPAQQDLLKSLHSRLRERMVEGKGLR